MPTFLVGGLGGATGGFMEVMVQSLIQQTRPSFAEAGTQAARLFFCFGTFTALSDYVMSPRPFTRAWVEGATAGYVGSVIIGAAQGLRRRALWLNTGPKGAFLIGTTIAVQVRSSDTILRNIHSLYT